MKFFLSSALFAVSLAAAQTPTAAPRSQVSGIVAGIDAVANQLTLKSGQGDAVTVTTTDRTLVLR